MTTAKIMSHVHIIELCLDCCSFMTSQQNFETIESEANILSNSFRKHKGKEEQKCVTPDFLALHLATHNNISPSSNYLNQFSMKLKKIISWMNSTQT
ncbi:CLUMA_CG017840, isoform A [Clunio marinus]|uniref:CLUMA_CG017840, isoform A n=1 Tax=Clunio marinus TaxID=568069 RepID=A0A1J1IXG1_9DIPT|nr:CLUMA_CG017840, isoform A [Clunio marinus]